MGESYESLRGGAALAVIIVSGGAVVVVVVMVGFGAVVVLVMVSGGAGVVVVLVIVGCGAVTVVLVVSPDAVVVPVVDIGGGTGSEVVGAACMEVWEGQGQGPLREHRKRVVLLAVAYASQFALRWGNCDVDPSSIFSYFYTIRT